MPVRKEAEREHAKLLFIKQNLDQKEIASRVNVTEKTISKWITEGKWREQKRSLLHTRNNIIRRLEEQMERWGNKIDKQEDGIATAKEADLLVKLASSIKKLEDEIGIGEIITANMELIDFVKSIDYEFSKKLTQYADLFINSKIK